MPTCGLRDRPGCSGRRPDCSGRRRSRLELERLLVGIDRLRPGRRFGIELAAPLEPLDHRACDSCGIDGFDASSASPDRRPAARSMRRRASGAPRGASVPRDRRRSARRAPRAPGRTAAPTDRCPLTTAAGPLPGLRTPGVDRARDRGSGGCAAARRPARSAPRMLRTPTSALKSSCSGGVSCAACRLGAGALSRDAPAPPGNSSVRCQ